MSAAVVMGVRGWLWRHPLAALLLVAVAFVGVMKATESRPVEPVTVDAVAKELIGRTINDFAGKHRSIRSAECWNAAGVNLISAMSDGWTVVDCEFDTDAGPLSGMVNVQISSREIVKLEPKPIRWNEADRQWNEIARRKK